MNKIWKVVSLIGLVAIAFGATSLAYAQTESPQPYGNPGYGSGMMGGRGRNGSGMAYGEFGPYHEVMVGSFAEALGISVEDLESRLESGETMWQIFEAEGATRDEFFAIMKDARTAMLEQALEDGTISQEQAEFKNSRGGFGQGQSYGGCMGYEDGDPQGLQRGHHGRWNAP